MTTGADSSVPLPPEEMLRRSRRYLLDQLSADERDAFERELLRSPELLEATEVAEDTLLLEYRDGRLSGDERQLVDSRFFDRSRRADLAVLRAIGQQAPPVTARQPATVLRPVRWWARPELALAATIMLAVGATAGWLAAARWQGIESVRRVDVAATSVRDQGGATEFVASTDYEWTRLRLALPAGGSATDVFRIALRSAAGASASPLWIRDAIATNDSSGRSVTIDVPSRLLAPGGYFVSVSRRTTQAPEPVLETAIVVR